jgi:hypothetical protein
LHFAQLALLLFHDCSFEAFFIFGQFRRSDRRGFALEHLHAIFGWEQLQLFLLATDLVSRD